ncbi:MAG: type II secretion system F family protein [Planctomycetota bacterium]
MNNFLLVGLFVISAALVIYSLWPGLGDGKDAIKRRMTGRSGSAVANIRKQAKESVARRVLNSVAPLAVRPVMPTNVEEMSKLRIRMAQAGIRAENAPTAFLASKTVVGIALAAAGILYCWAKGSAIGQGVGITMVCAGVGFLAPNLWLTMAISKRGEKIRNGLADVLDLLVISVESGLGLDAAFQRVGDEMKLVHPALSEELQLVTLESQMGIPRSEALTNFTTRTGIMETQSLVAIINQAERFGTSIARALRNQSDALRIKRRQKAEERAQQTTVKLMAPLILFIFPAILVVLAGPAGLKMAESLKSTPGLQ